jgi:hypothetical protein
MNRLPLHCEELGSTNISPKTACLMSYGFNLNDQEIGVNLEIQRYVYLELILRGHAAFSPLTIIHLIRRNSRFLKVMIRNIKLQNEYPGG